jgi:hypothetical protein
MAEMSQLETALRNADAAGDVNAARALAGEIVKMRGGAPTGNKTWTDSALDFAKSIPRGVVTGLTSAPSTSMVPLQDYEAEVAPTRERSVNTLKAGLPSPQGGAGKLGEAVGEGLGNPASYIGPGSLPLKIGATVLSSLGSEGAGQASEGTAYETPSRVAGALAGGIAGAKAFGPSTPKAAIPTTQELKAAAERGYTAARNSGLELNPNGVSSFATKVEQELIGPDFGFTGGPTGVAPKTLSVIEQLRNPPAGATITASNFDTIRKNLGRIASETNEGKATPDAAAASIALDRLKNYTENIPKDHIVAGDATSYVREIKDANANYGAFARTRDFDARLTKAENATDRQVAGSLDSQIKSKAGQMLDNPKASRGLSEAELEQLQLINSGGPFSNTLRQLGRGGAGVIPLMTQAAVAAPLAAATGGASIIPQAAVAAALYSARKGSEAITKSRAQTLAEMLAKRSPEYEARVAGLPPADSSPAVAAIVRAMMQGN